ncbi:siderophore-interacting protein [Sciscionella sediminilitoris]|uniref:siderophore-interacting protein n=1 Tax=Sciscionella sediminilitoris TaxID=1445613 RepID=UPI0004DF86E0|nr:siderophore-interacting protein [Sciscionella sp. SE31]
MTSIRQEIRRITQHGQGPFSCEVEVERVWPISRGFRRVAVHGPGLAQYRDIWPADAFKLMLPGSEQPLPRAYTVRSFDPERNRIEFDVAEHRGGPGMAWLERTGPGEVVGFAGMRHEFSSAAPVDRHLIVGDASALPAAAAILESLPPEVPALVCLSTAEESDKALLPERARTSVHWAIGQPREALAELVRSVAAPQGRTQAWLAAEAAVVRELRRFTLEECGVDRQDMQARAYWKAGVDSTAIDADSIVRYQKAMADGLDVTDPDVVDRMEFETAGG